MINPFLPSITYIRRESSDTYISHIAPGEGDEK